MNAMRKDELSMHCTCTAETGQEHSAVDTGESNCVQLTLAKRVIKRRSNKTKYWLLAAAAVSVTALCIFCNPTWMPSFVAQTATISKQPASLKVADGSAVQDHGSTGGAHRTVASDKDETGKREITKPGSNQTATPKAAAAKTVKSETSFMVPPPPPTPVVLPSGFGLLPGQPEQQALQQQLLQAQAQDSLITHNQSATGDIRPQQSDPDLQAVDQELEAAMRSSQLRAREWKR